MLRQIQETFATVLVLMLTLGSSTLLHFYIVAYRAHRQFSSYITKVKLISIGFLLAYKDRFLLFLLRWNIYVSLVLLHFKWFYWPWTEKVFDHVHWVGTKR